MELQGGWECGASKEGKGRLQVSCLAAQRVCICLHGWALTGTHSCNASCRFSYPGMNWGDGFITNIKTLDKYNLSDPSFLFK